ncbi:MAG: flagellar hook basal-body protein [Myxococcaceae bacterium]|jgi:flagellar basal-body rod protein FlgF|nr:flagellar hook basal-body protein [Myxococcaceae bacterium]MCA3016717.1 flagellar hook basal-body protein [Myxococcaceae bacterium]
MADGIYVSMNGAAARMAQLDSVSDNLANLNTPGFKAARPAFEAFVAQSAGASPELVYPAPVQTQLDLSKGAVVHSGDPMDVLPTGKAFLAVKLADGLAYTRNGRIQLDGDNVLRVNGQPLVDGAGGTIVAPPQSVVRVEPNGDVFANNQRIATIGLFELTGSVDRVSPTLLRPQVADEVAPSTATLRLGEYELGNASALEATVQLVSAQRHFDTSMQALQTYRKLDERAVELGRVR